MVAIKTNAKQNCKGKIKQMNIKQLKAILSSQSNNFQIVKTDSVYIPSKYQLELIDNDSTLGIYRVVGLVSFNQFIKLNLQLIHKQSKGSLYTQSFYKLIKE